MFKYFWLIKKHVYVYMGYTISKLRSRSWENKYCLKCLGNTTIWQHISKNDHGTLYD